MVYVPLKQMCFFQLGVNNALTQFVYEFKTGALKNTTTAQFTDMVRISF